MSLRKKLVNLKNDNYYLRWLWFKSIQSRARKAAKISDMDCITANFLKSFGREPDLTKPLLFYEKLNWLKLNYRNELMPVLSDKYLVHRYLTEKGYGSLLNDILGVWDSIKDFDENILPEKFVLKASHASGTAWLEVVKDKSRIKWAPLKKVMNEWLHTKIDWMGREWHYGSMTPRIIAERYLEDETGELRDYKFHCFNGVPKFVNVCIGRFTGSKQFICMDLDWNVLPFTSDALNLPEDIKIRKPDNFDKMIELAREFSKGFPYIRVDFYNVKGKIYFGEFTFFDFGAFAGPYTSEAQKTIGNWLTLPEANI